MDLAVARLDPGSLDDLELVVRERRDAVAGMLRHRREHASTIRQYLTLAEWVSTLHGIRRLEAELAWHDELLAAVPDIVRDERTRTQDQDPS